MGDATSRMVAACAAIVFVTSGLYGYFGADKAQFDCMADVPQSIFQPLTKISLGLEAAGRDVGHAISELVHADSDDPGRQVLIMIAAAGLGYFGGYGLRYMLEAPICGGRAGRAFGR